ncbi:family 20 glycosylhydrolase [Photobacterium nomapromontoriensis]|uniref:family 20 glycosylhydrolase n=1 Tax=Photobacterium nomapromontoriensis TaxID=2910237 RepID=UPI003D1171E3
MKLSRFALLVSAGLILAGCDGEDGKDGVPGGNVGVINEAPKTIPSLKFWHGKTGFTDLTAKSRIIINADDAKTLAILEHTAALFNEDLRALNGMELEIITNGGEGEAGDIVYNITGFIPPAHDLEAHDESYTVSIDGKVVITAPEIRGAAYASATLKQMLSQDAYGKDSLSNGLIQDEPTVRVRGFMIDIGRRSASVEFLKNYLRFMSYYKMSEFQLHLNDNQIIWGDGITGSNWAEDTWREKVYAGFSAELKNTYALPELASVSSKHDPDNNIFVLSLSDLQELRDMADALGIELTGEIEAPAHAMSFTKIYPEMRHPDMRPDHLDLGSAKTMEVIKATWDQLAPYFHNLHIGADEYAGMPASEDMDKEHLISAQMVNYMNEMNAYLKDKGYNEIRVWGNLGTITNPHRPDLDKDIVHQVWAGTFADTEKAYRAGYKLINLNDAYYTVPTGNAGYPDTVSPANMYKNWHLNTFSGGWQIPDINDPQFLGGFVANWNDLGWSKNWAYTDHDVHVRMRNVIKIAAQKMWNNETVLPFEEFQNLAYTLGESPTFDLGNPAYDGNLVKAKSAYGSSYRDIIYALGAAPDNAKLLTVNFLGHAGAAIDGDPKSRWIASKKDGSSAWLSIDLHKPETISRISIDWGKGWASKYRIETSKDGFSWKTAATADGAGAMGEETVFPSVDARFVRIQGVTMGTEEAYQIHEVRIFK